MPSLQISDLPDDVYQALAFCAQQEHRSLAQQLRYNVATLPLSERITMPAEDVVRARIDKQVKAEAAEVLESMGLSLSDAIRLLLMRVAKDKALPFALKAPNAETREAIAELEAGRGERFESIEALMADLNADD